MVQREPETALHETWARDFDMVIAEQYPAHAAPHLPGLDRSDLTTDAIRLALPPRETALRPVSSLEDARTMPWVMEPRGDRVAALRRAGVPALRVSSPTSGTRPPTCRRTSGWSSRATPSA